MQILFISAFFYPHKGGIELYAQELILNLTSDHSNITADILTYNTDNSARTETYDGISITRIPCFPIVPGQFYLPYLFSLITTLWNLRLNSYDIVITQTRFFDTTWWAWIYAKLIGAKSIFIAHGTGFVSHTNPLVRFMSKVIDLTIASFSVKRYDERIAISKATQDFYKTKLGINDTILIPGGIDTQLFDIPKSESSILNNLNLSPETTIMTYVGRLIRAKGIFGLVDAVSEVSTHNPDKPLHLVVAGTGPEEQELRTYVNKKGCSDFISLVGSVEYSEIPLLLSNTTIFINPSYNDGLPRSVMEAAASGISVIATNVGSTKDILNKYGFLVEPHNVSHIADAITTILQNPKEERQRAAEHKTYIQKTFDWIVISNKIYEQFIQLGKPHE